MKYRAFKLMFGRRASEWYRQLRRTTSKVHLVLGQNTCLPMVEKLT